jgi:FkbM family methyltransferase
MAKANVKHRVQTILAKAGYQLRRVEGGSSVDDPYAMQRALLGPGVETIFEVGAADGTDTENYCRDYPRADVYAFEPLDESFAKVQARAGTNPRLKPFQIALSDREGESTFFIAESNDSSSLLPPRETGSNFDEHHQTRAEQTVKTTTLDTFRAEQGIGRIDLLKVDAQGAELSILDGAEQTLTAGQVSLIFIEVQFIPAYEGAPRYDELATRLYSKGFSLHNFYDLQHDQHGRLCWGDALFVHESFTPAGG